jgi:C1A family cysteine protease
LPENLDVQKIALEKTSFEQSEKIEISEENLVYAVSVSGSGTVNSKRGYARVLVEDDAGKLYLVYASDFLSLEDSFEVSNLCDETCNFEEGKQIKKIIIEIKDATLNIEGIDFLTDESLTNSLISAEEIKNNQQTSKVNRLNSVIKEKKMHWVAGDTGVSRLSYEEKKKLLGALADGENRVDELSDLDGFWYYIGGIFEVSSDEKIGSEIYSENQETQKAVVEENKNIVPEENIVGDENNPSDGNLITGEAIALGGEDEGGGDGLPESWDWRNIHGENWVTPVKSQMGCGTCWAFGAVGATELAVNLYYNQHINLDLSEQDLLSCSNQGNCNGGGGALYYVTNEGIVNEVCFPYAATKLPCSNRCANPAEKIRITDSVIFLGHGERTLKKMIISYGGVEGIITPWHHDMALIGYGTLHEGDMVYDGSYYGGINDPIFIRPGDPLIGQTYWVFKNSWGEGHWGEGGFGKVYVYSISDLTTSQGIVNPVMSDIVPREIRCVDNDRDGFCNWGISKTKPANCPSCSDKKDCNDADFNIRDEGCNFNMCYDSDGGENYGVSGFVEDANSILYDRCWPSSNFIDEYYCEGDVHKLKSLSCEDVFGEGSKCENGACKPPSQCYDHVDNDGDGKCDSNGCNGMPKDPSCFYNYDTSEWGRPRFYVDSKNGRVAIFNMEGEIFLRGTCTVAGSCNAIDPAFAIRDLAGNLIAKIDNGGNLCVLRGSCTQPSTSCVAGPRDFAITKIGAWNNEPAIVIGENGLCFIGAIYQNRGDL